MNCFASMDKGRLMDKDAKFGMKVVGAILLFMLLIYFWAYAYQDKEQTVIERQLDAIQSNRLTEAYYAFTTKEFQSATSLEDFKEFLINFPLFTSDASVKFEKGDTAGQVRVHFKKEEEEMNVLFTLSKDDKDWHVFRIEVVPESLPDFDSSLFLGIIKGFTEAIKAGKLDQAYEEFTSDPFKETTSFENFERFVKESPVLQGYEKVKYGKLVFNNNRGTYDVLMIDKNGDLYELKYDLTLDGKQWKIVQIQISNAL